MADWKFSSEPYCFVPETPDGQRSQDIALTAHAVRNDGLEVYAVRSYEGKIGGNITSQPQGKNGYELEYDGQVKALGQPPVSLPAPTASELRENFANMLNRCRIKGPGV
jgi:hypothetical protein